MARLSPMWGVRKPRIRRPRVMPSQKPVAVMPEGKGGAWRTRIMKVTIQPPRETGVLRGFG